MRNKIEDRVTRVMSAVFEIAEENIKDDSSPDTIESWDSLKHINLVVALEEEFKSEFSEDEILEMLNYKLIINIITSKI